VSTLSVEQAQSLYLPGHVCACKTDDGIVFLDTRHDRYFGLGGECASALADSISNWPGRQRYTQESAAMLPQELQAMANALFERGLLAQGPIDSVPTARAVIPKLTIQSSGLAAAARSAVRPLDLLRFISACARAAWSLRWRSLESIELGVRAGRARLEMQAAANARDALELTRVFFKLRRWLFSEKNRCLLNALSLVYFLRPYGHFPYFVVGVKTGPFAAHSWVQQDHTVLDGEPASVCHFVPILVA
jgi:hypothetical protein